MLENTDRLIMIFLAIQGIINLAVLLMLVFQKSFFQGPKGARGDTGMTGKDAYLLAVDDGYVGSRQKYNEEMKEILALAKSFSDKNKLKE